MFSSLPAHLLLYLLPIISTANAALVNVTVDDASPDPLTGQQIAYAPLNAWNNGPTCTACVAPVDKQQMYGQSWHDGTYFSMNSIHPPSGPLTVTFTFNGTAIYAYCALVQAAIPFKLTAYSNMTFYIDGDLVGQFEWIPTGEPGLKYKVPVYSNSSLPPGLHQFVLQNGLPANQGSDSLVLFDFLKYSYDNGALSTSTPGSNSNSASSPNPTSSGSNPVLPSSRSSPPVGAIVGGVVGGVVALSFIAFAIWWYLQKRKQDHIDKMIPKPYNLHDSISQPLMIGYGGGEVRVINPGTNSGFSSTPNVSNGLGREVHKPPYPTHAVQSSVASSYRTSTPLRELDTGPVTLPPEYRSL